MKSLSKWRIAELTNAPNASYFIFTPMQIELTPEFRNTLDLLEQGKDNLFITGRAGTGKSTLLQQFREVTSKNIVILAPTGVSAINVGGETIHSFFGFKPNTTPESVKKIRGKRALFYKKIEVIVIDEISMVRADLLDAVAQFLFFNGRAPGEPFGGVKIVFFGDLHQLPPVIRRNEEAAFAQHYETPYFFSAHAFESLSLYWIELTRVFRQTDEAFLEILNHLRDHTISDDELLQLNQRVENPKVIASLTGGAAADCICLTTTNQQALTINRTRLLELPDKEHLFTATVEGTFEENTFPTAVSLELKVGARIMMLNNDSRGRWVNGTLATIKAIDLQGETLQVILANDSEEDVVPYTWEMFQFSLDREGGRLVPVSIGKFTQMPVRLAWAITIHKSQGLTFENAIIDLSRGTFAHGQLYVAISRLKTLEGLTLTHPVRKRDILLDERILRFCDTHQSRTPNEPLSLTIKMERIDEAIRKKRTIAIVYITNTNEQTKRRVTPIRMGEMTYQGKGYIGLLARCHRLEEEKRFAVDRILDITVENLD
ncbi:MAG: AAA family ATPase [Nitrospirota bacterium]